MIAGVVLFLLAVSWLRIRFTVQVRDLDGRFRVEVSAIYSLVRFELGRGAGGGRVRSRETGSGTTGRPRASIPAMVRVARTLLSKTTCTRLVMNARIGTGEASSTGLSTGLAWEVVGVAVSFARESVGRWRCSPSVNIAPSFLESGLDLDLDLILAVRLGHVVIAGLRLAWEALKRGTGFRRRQGVSAETTG